MWSKHVSWNAKFWWLNHIFVGWLKLSFWFVTLFHPFFLGGEYPRSALTKSSVHVPRSTWPACRANGGTKNSWMVYRLQWKIHCKLIVWMVWMYHKWIWMIWMYPGPSSSNFQYPIIYARVQTWYMVYSHASHMGNPLKIEWICKILLTDELPSPNMDVQSNFLQNPARAKSQHQRPFPVKGGTRCKDGGEPKMASTQLSTMYWLYARKMSH